MGLVKGLILPDSLVNLAKRTIEWCQRRVHMSSAMLETHLPIELDAVLQVPSLLPFGQEMIISTCSRLCLRISMKHSKVA